MKFLKKRLTLNCHACPGKEPHLYKEFVGPEWPGLSSLWKLQANKFSWQWDEAHQFCVTTSTLWYERCMLTNLGRSHSHTSRDGWRGPWAVVLEICSYWYKGLSIRWMAHFNKKKYLHLNTHWDHSHQSTELYISIQYGSFIMVYPRGTCELNTSNFFLSVKKDSCVMAILHT